MAGNTVHLDAVKLMGSVTVNIVLHRAREMRVRSKLSAWLILLACHIGGYGGARITYDDHWKSKL